MNKNLKRVTLIYNPTAGSLRRDPSQVDRLIKELQWHGFEISQQQTLSPGHASDLAGKSAADGVETLIVCGGDGTINEAVQGLVGTNTALAVWPCGTANVLAEELKLPRNPKALVGLITKENLRVVSVGHAMKPETGWHRYFLLMAGIGLDASIVNGVDLDLKRLTGKGAYFASGLEYLARLPLTPFSIGIDGERYESTFAVISNAANYAGWFTLAPQARMDDDKLYICSFNSRSRLAYLGYAFLSMTGKHTRSSGVVCQQAQKIKANSNDAALVQLDGDVVGNLPMQFEIVPEALRVYAP